MYLPLYGQESHNKITGSDRNNKLYKIFKDKGKGKILNFKLKITTRWHLKIVY